LVTARTVRDVISRRLTCLESMFICDLTSDLSGPSKAGPLEERVRRRAALSQ
jgi:hypothetical protein